MTVAEITTAEVAAMMRNDDDFVLLDVRSKRAFERGHLPGAVSAPEDDPSQITFPPGTTFDTPVVVYCYIGVKSMQVATYLDSIGFSDVTSMKGGHTAWRFLKGRPADQR